MNLDELEKQNVHIHNPQNITLVMPDGHNIHHMHNITNSDIANLTIESKVEEEETTNNNNSNRNNNHNNRNDKDTTTGPTRQSRGSLEEKLKIMNLKESIASMTSSGRYADVIGKLQELILMQQDSWDIFDTQVNLVEVLCKLERFIEVYKTLPKLYQTLREMDGNANVVGEMATSHFQKKQYIKSLVFYVCQGKMHLESKADPDDIVRGINWCVKEIYTIFVQLISTDRNICKHLIVPMIRDAMDDMQSVKNSSMRVSVLTRAWCLLYISYCHSEYKEYKEQKVAISEACDKLESKLGFDAASKYRVFGYCLNNLGVALGNLQEHEGAIDAYQRTLTVYNLIEDWLSDNDKEQRIKQTKNNLKLSRKELKLIKSKK